MADIEIKVVVAITNAGGEPDLVMVQVDCSEEQYSNGEHYEMADELVDDAHILAGWRCDENDPGFAAIRTELL